MAASSASSSSWEERAKTKRDSTNSLIPDEWRISKVPSSEERRDITGLYLHQYLSPREIEITETLPEHIVQKTSTGQWTAEEVMRAFAHRAALAHQHVSCLLEIFFESGIEDAKKLDQYYNEHKKPVGPLHGLPISLKDQFHVKGVETTMGYVGWVGTFEGKSNTGLERVFESEMVRELRNLGALLYCKTSVPHTLMCGETINNITGYTYNPKNRNLSSGGSSGGEGALISLRGSPLGFGTDIGGSIRIPAAFCGIYGIRPSAGRMPYEGMANSMDGQNSILSVVGPLSTSVGGLRLAIKTLLSQQPWLHDPMVHEMPWREDQHDQVVAASKEKGQLAFAVMQHDGVVQPYPPVTRAVNTVVELLQKRGHKVINWEPPSHAKGLEVAANTFDYDGGADARSAFSLSGETPAQQIAVRHEAIPQQNAQQIAANNVAKRAYQKDYLDYWNSTADLTGTGRPVDAVICPAAYMPAARPARYTHYGYTTIWNVLDYTASVLPVTTVNKAVDKVLEGFTPLNEEDKTCQADYEPEIYDGAAVAVQIVGRRLQEEKVLALTDYIAEALKGGKRDAKL